MVDQIRIPHVVITFFPSFSKAILRTAELPSLCRPLCNVVSFIYPFSVPHFAMTLFMFIYWHYRISKQCWGHVVRILLKADDCWSFKTFNHPLNHSKIHAARQFCDFQCLSAIEYDLTWIWGHFQKMGYFLTRDFYNITGSFYKNICARIYSL